MKVVGIIAEYNPFHNGHLYHLERSMEVSHSDYSIVVLSGDFTQRGAPAITDKYARANMALESGADLVLELPVLYACHSAEYFAKGAVNLLDSLGLVTSLCFGSECGEVSSLNTLAHFLLNEPAAYQDALQNFLKQGFSFPSAREKAMETCISDTSLVSLLKNPNNILGIEYCKALLAKESTITPMTILREGASYHDQHLAHEKTSALAIRTALNSGTALSNLTNFLPACTCSTLETSFLQGGPIFSDDFSTMLQYKLLESQASGYSQYLDVSSDLSDRITNQLSSFTTFTEFCSLLKTKELTYTRISRCLLHILLDIKKQPTEPLLIAGATPYARILGFREHALPLLSALKEYSTIPLLSKLSIADTLLSDTGNLMLSYDLFSHRIYQAALYQKYGCNMPSEYSRKILRL